MKEVITQLFSALEAGQNTMLVTLMGDTGTAPRSAGVQMLVGQRGRQTGTIGGGMLEKSSQAMALSLLESKQSVVHTFLLGRNGAGEAGMVCGGDACVHFQYISAADQVWKQVIAAAAGLVAAHRGGWLVLREDGSAPSLFAIDRQWLAGDAAVQQVADLGPGHCTRGEGYFALPLPVGTRALIFGAGHIARCLTPILSSVDFRPVIFDWRPEFAVQGLFPDAERVICGDIRELAAYLTVTEEDFIVVAGSGHAQDCDVEEQILRGPFAYLGVIGSRAKTAAINQKLLARGITGAQLAMVHTPIGTDIKAVTPAEIAVSIAGEMILVRQERRRAAAGAASC